MQPRNRNLLLVVIAAFLLLCCCATAAVLAVTFGTRAILSGNQEVSRPTIMITRVVTATRAPARDTVEPTATSLPEPPTPTGRPAPATQPAPGGEATVEAQPTEAPPAPPTPQPAPTGGVGAQEGEAELAYLTAAEMPAADKRDLTMRLKAGSGDIPLVVNTNPPDYKLGDKAEFWTSNSDTQDHKKITAELKVLTEHVAMWVEEGVRVNQSDLEASAKRFEEKTYPTNREFFGSEWTPGVDSDVRLHILHATDLGDTVAGYYSSADEYSREVNQYSNEHEMFYISVDAGSSEPNTEFYDGTLAHEFQHMIHWANDRNETSWVNEGLSELASDLNGYDAGGADVAYSRQPDTQLTTWGDPAEGNLEHYGASYLFMTYFLDRFGEDLTKAVVASPRNGVSGFNEALAGAGRTETFDDIFADWTLANYLDQPDADDQGRYGYKDLDPFPMSIAETHRSYPADGTAQVSQYGADYLRLRGNGPLIFEFEGDTEASLVPAQTRGEFSWWSNRGDLSDATLTRAVDLSAVTKATLKFSLWYDLEDGWDYAYVAASTDSGKRWEILEGRQTTDEDPVGNALGVGWTGKSGGGDTPRWVDEEVDLSAFAGKEILLRFEYVTDDAVNGPGLLLDDVSIDEIDFADDGETGLAAWEPNGFILTDNRIDQRWLVQVLEMEGGTVTVKRVDVDGSGKGSVEITDPGALNDAVVVISALTPVTTETAAYSYHITRK